LVVSAGIAGDINGDGLVNALDYVVGRIGDPEGDDPALVDWAANYTGALSGSGSGAGAAVPEPSSMLLVLLGMAAATMRRRGR
jgi:hypothetical protein